MLSVLIYELSTIFFIAAVVNYHDDNSKYYEIEKSEKIEYDNSTSATLPDAETFVIGVKRALLPFRQLSKYLRRPVNDRRNGKGFACIQWKTPQQESPELIVKSQNQKRWDSGNGDKTDEEANCPEIILIRPVNMSQEGDTKMSNVNRDADDAIKPHQNVGLKVSDRQEVQTITTQLMLKNNKKLKVDNQIFQGNRINIKRTISVDVGNQSKALEGSSSTTNKSQKKIRKKPGH